jgi:ribosomal protein S18 acetylase RimI-like enzyme
MAQVGIGTVPQSSDIPAEINYGVPSPPDYGPLARDRIPVRSMTKSDLGALTNIDRRITGGDRSRYLEQKLTDALDGSDVRVSLVAEVDGRPVGFIMARVDLGEYGRADPAAIMDTIGVDPDYRDRGVGRALLSQLLANLGTLRVEKILTEVDWTDGELLSYFERCGFQPSSRLCFDRDLA